MQVSVETTGALERRMEVSVPRERIEQAIDRAAMKVGASDTDAYLAEWRKGEPYPVEGDATEIAAAEAARIDREYDKERLIALIANDGRA